MSPANIAVRSAHFILWKTQLSGKVLGPRAGEDRVESAHKQRQLWLDRHRLHFHTVGKDNLVGITQRDTREKESNLARQFVFVKKKKKM